VNEKPENIIKSVRHELQMAVKEHTVIDTGRFFKEDVMFYGLKSPVIRTIAKRSFNGLADRKKETVFLLCELLWQSGYLEETAIACLWSHAVRGQYKPGDFQVFERWINHYVTNWAACDMLCNHTVGDFLMMYPGHLSELQRWAASENRWMRRAATVSLIIPARKGLFTEHILRLADILLKDPDDMVQKGYGWMLKVTSQSNQQLIFEYVMQNKFQMPRTALRYAIEKMPRKLRDEAMRKD